MGVIIIVHDAGMTPTATFIASRKRTFLRVQRRDKSIVLVNFQVSQSFLYLRSELKDFIHGLDRAVVYAADRLQVFAVAWVVATFEYK